MIKITDIKAGDTVRIKNYGDKKPFYWAKPMMAFQGKKVLIQNVLIKLYGFEVLQNENENKLDNWLFLTCDIEEIMSNEQEETEQVTWDFTTNIFENGFD